MHKLTQADGPGKIADVTEIIVTFANDFSSEDMKTLEKAVLNEKPESIATYFAESYHPKGTKGYKGKGSKGKGKGKGGNLNNTGGKVVALTNLCLDIATIV